MTTYYGPCEDWDVAWTCDITGAPEVTGAAVAVATEVVWALSGRQFGLCRVTLRPCRRDCVDEAYWGRELFLPTSGTWPQPALINGNWFNIICGNCGGTCSCSHVSEIILPNLVHNIVSVKIDGDVMPTGSYRVDDGRKLVLLDGDWPLCNDLNLDDDQVGTWSVTADYGRDVPEGGDWAVGALACELIKAMQGADCRLPKNVVELARQGVRIKFPDSSELFDRGRTGIYLTDLFIATWNPSGLKRRSKTYDVDYPGHRRTDTVPGP